MVLNEGEDTAPGELRGYLAKRVARWWLPERRAFIDEAPKTGVGKFDQKLLRAPCAHGELEVHTR